MKIKGGFFSLLQIILLAFLLGSAATLYVNGGFGVGFALFLGLSAGVSGPVLLGIYRRFGLFVSVGLMIAFSVGIFSLIRDPATGVLTCTLCFSVPLSVSFLWPRFRNLRGLTKVVLPVAGALVAGGFLIYCKLHFGFWTPYAAVERIAARLVLFLDQMRPFYAEFYEGAMLEEMYSLLNVMVQNAEAIARELIFYGAYALLGIFYFSVLWADRVGMKQGQFSGCGSWSQLIPRRSLSWLYMAGYLVLNFINIGNLYQPAAATLTLFGFYYVFTAVYRLDRFLYKKQAPSIARALIAVLLLSVALLSAGNVLFLPYSILLYVGWWIATSPRRTIQKS